MTRRSLFRRIAGAFVGSILARTAFLSAPASHLLQFSLKQWAAEILHQQEIIQSYLDRLKEIESHVRAFESQFGIPSERIHEAIDAGELTETEDVCEWIMEYELLQATKVS